MTTTDQPVFLDAPRSMRLPVLLALLERADRTGLVRGVSTRVLGKAAGMHHGTVESAVDALESAGWLTLSRGPGGNANAYLLDMARLEAAISDEPVSQPTDERVRVTLRDGRAVPLVGTPDAIQAAITVPIAAGLL
jgi:hypothetical protein